MTDIYRNNVESENMRLKAEVERLEKEVSGLENSLYRATNPPGLPQFPLHSNIPDEELWSTYFAALLTRTNVSDPASAADYALKSHRKRYSK